MKIGILAVKLAMILSFQSCNDDSGSALGSGIELKDIPGLDPETVAQIEDQLEGEIENPEENTEESGGEKNDEVVQTEDDEKKDDEVAQDEDKKDEDQKPGDSDSKSEVVSYKFNHLSGKCESEDGALGYNKGVISECGDLSGQNISNADFKGKKKKLFGLSLKDTYISKSKVRVGHFVYFEALFNEGSKIKGVKKLFPKLFKGHANFHKAYTRSIQKNQKKLKATKAKLAKLMKTYRKLDKEKHKKKYERKILAYNKRVTKLKDHIAVLSNKRIRHKNYSKTYGNME